MNVKATFKLFSVALAAVSCLALGSCGEKFSSNPEQEAAMRDVTVNITMDDATEWGSDKGLILFNKVSSPKSYRLTTTSTESSTSASFAGKAPIEKYDLLGFTYPDYGVGNLPSQVKIDLSQQSDDTQMLYAGNAIFENEDAPLAISMTPMFTKVDFDLLIDPSVEVSLDKVDYVSIYSPSLSVTRYLKLSDVTAGVQWIGGLTGQRITLNSENFTFRPAVPGAGITNYDHFGFSAHFFKGATASLEVSLVSKSGEYIYTAIAELTEKYDFVVVDYYTGKTSGGGDIDGLTDGEDQTGGFDEGIKDNFNPTPDPVDPILE